MAGCKIVRSPLAVSWSVTSELGGAGLKDVALRRWIWCSRRRGLRLPPGSVAADSSAEALSVHDAGRRNAERGDLCQTSSGRLASVSCNDYSPWTAPKIF